MTRIWRVAPSSCFNCRDQGTRHLKCGRPQCCKLSVLEVAGNGPNTCSPLPGKATEMHIFTLRKYFLFCVSVLSGCLGVGGCPEEFLLWSLPGPLLRLTHWVPDPLNKVKSPQVEMWCSAGVMIAHDLGVLTLRELSGGVSLHTRRDKNAL